MDYVRGHIKRYWGITYRRTLGISLITLAVALSMGLTFTVLTANLATANYLSYLIFWIILMLVTASVFLTNFFSSHVSSVKYMYEEEHKAHSKRMALCMVMIVVGIVILLIPLILSRGYMEPITLLFSFGGAFLLVYFTIFALFKHKYTELAIGGVALWIMFLLGMSQLSNSVLVNSAAKSYFSLYFATMSITIISGFIGLALLYNSSKESMHEFISDMERIKKDEKKVKVRSQPIRKRK